MLPNGSGPVTDWAIYSKNPDETPDYGILAASFDPGRARTLARAGIPGNPDVASHDDDRLPWVAFITDETGPPQVGVVVTSPSTKADFHKRPIAPSRLLVMPFAQASDYALTFGTTAGLLSQIDGWENAVNQGPPGLTGRIQFVAPAPANPTRTARLIDELGFDWFAAVAATLLDRGQVVIVSATPYPTLGRRIEILDAVCALLPFGYRARLSAATWASERSDHALRLTFAPRARSGQAQAHIVPRTDPPPDPHLPAADWVAGASAPEPTSRAGVAYRRALHELRDKNSTNAVIQYLAGQRNAGACATPEDVLERLRDMDLPTATYEEIGENPDRPDRILRVLDRIARVLDGGGWSSWDETRRPAVMSFVAERGLAADQRIVEAAGLLLSRHWTDELADHLARAGVAGLPSGSTDPLRRWAVLLQADQAQRLLLGVTRLVVGTKLVDGMPAFADLIWNPAPGTEPFQPSIHAELLRDPGLAAHLLATAIEPSHDPDRLRVLLNTWDHAGTGGSVDWVVPFVAAVMDIPVTAGQLEALNHLWPAGIVVAARACLLRGRLAQMPSAMWADLVRYVARAAMPGQADLVVEADGLVMAALTRNLTERECARIDVVSIALHGIARSSQNRDFDLPEEYFREFSALWREQSLAPLRERLLASAAVPATSANHARHSMRLADAVGPELVNPVTRSVTAFMNQGLPDWKAVIRVTTEQWASILRTVYGDAIELQRLCEQGGDRSGVLRAAVNAAGNSPDLLPIVGGLLADWARSLGDIGVFRLLMGLAETRFIRWEPPLGEAAERLRSHVLAQVADGRLGDPKFISAGMDTLREFLAQQNKALQSEIKSAGKRR